MVTAGLAREYHLTVYRSARRKPPHVRRCAIARLG
jgi:hypothetical protein